MQSREHTSSYYAATANRRTDFPPLRGEQSADVCVIGAGFTGISTALTLAERGYQVRVVEANRVGWGASGRNGGQMIGGISGEKRIAREHGREVEALLGELRWAGHHIIRERVDRYGIRCSSCDAPSATPHVFGCRVPLCTTCGSWIWRFRCGVWCVSAG